MSPDEQQARDFAEYFDLSMDEAVAALKSALIGKHPPLVTVRKYPRYVRYLPEKWRQKWAMWRLGL